MYGGGSYGSFAFGSEEEVPAVEEQSDDWWGVMGIKAASIALAGALAISSSAAQANTRLINSLGEEVTTYVAPPVVGDISSPSYRVGPAQTSVLYILGSDDFPARPDLVSDENEILRPVSVPRIAPPARQPIAYEDVIVPQPQAPTPIGDNAAPRYTVAQQTSIIYIFGSDDFPPPAPPVVGDSARPAFSVGPPQTKVVYQFSGEDLPQQVIDSGDGLVWLSTAPPYKAPFIIFTQEDPPTLVTPPVLPIAVESASPHYTVGQSRTVIRYIFGDIELPIAVPAIAFEDDWAQPTPKYPLPRIIPPWVFGEVERVIPLPGDLLGILEGQVIGGPVMTGSVIGGSVFKVSVVGGSVSTGSVVSRESD